MSDAGFLGKRQEYDTGVLEPETLNPDPLAQLRDWFDVAVETNEIEPSAMCLSTVDSNIRPNSRVVLMRGIDDRGITFFTNFQSQKGDELARNSAVSAVFFWPIALRQVRVRGEVETVSDDEADAYWNGRPYLSQLASAASNQSTVIAGREVLEAEMSVLRLEFPEKVPRPKSWGGFRIVVSEFEFWQGRRSRAHDRFRYRPKNSEWLIERLAP